MPYRCCSLAIAFILLSSLAFAAEAPSWVLASPVFRLAKSTSDEPAVLLDPCAVRHDGQWHVFAGGPGGLVYYALSDFKVDGPAIRSRKLSCTGGGVPQVYFHGPTKQWHLIAQMGTKGSDGKTAFVPAISTNPKIENAEGWTNFTKMEVPAPIDDSGKVARWMDFYVIFDGDTAHLFGTSGGKLWRTETKAADFPQGWSKPVVALQGNIVYASHTYRQETDTGTRFLTTVTSSAQDSSVKKNKQYQVSYVANDLRGPWKPEFTSWEKPYAGGGNAKIEDPRWSGQIIHGEPLREGRDERMILEREPKYFVFHAKARLKADETSPSIDAVGILERVKK